MDYEQILFFAEKKIVYNISSQLLTKYPTKSDIYNDLMCILLFLYRYAVHTIYSNSYKLYEVYLKCLRNTLCIPIHVNCHLSFIYIYIYITNNNLVYTHLCTM